MGEQEENVVMEAETVEAVTEGLSEPVTESAPDDTATDHDPEVETPSEKSKRPQSEKHW